MPARKCQETLNLTGGYSSSDSWNDSVIDEVLQGRKMFRSDLKHTTQEGPLVLEAMDQGRVGCLGLGVGDLGEVAQLL